MSEIFIKSILAGNAANAYGTIIDIECHLSNSLPNIVIVGIATKAVDEAKERIRGAFASTDLKLPKKRITLNLAPADIPKEGSSFDLAMALAIMEAGSICDYKEKNTVIIGELGLNGTIRPVRGIIGKLLSAKKLGIKRFVIPKANEEQAMLVPGITIACVASLKDLYIKLSEKSLEFVPTKPIISMQVKDYFEITFDEIVGQAQAKRALLIAAAGHHNILLSGAPGTGKSMMAKALPSIMPVLSSKEMLEITHLHSLANKDFERIITKRPIRTPHHSSSKVSIIGGGQNPRPGEISLSHHGILLFDEIPEFSRSILEALRQPLEDRTVTVARAKDTVEFPAHFILVGTANPCPCGHYNTSKECSCLPHQIMHYQKKLSGPVLDRVDLFVDVDDIEHKELLSNDSPNAQNSYELRNAVTKAREKQRQRSGKLNSELSGKEIKHLSRMSDEAKLLLDKAATKLNLSARAYMRSVKVASTIADLNGEEIIGIPEITEALQYRKKQVIL